VVMVGFPWMVRRSISSPRMLLKPPYQVLIGVVLRHDIVRVALRHEGLVLTSDRRQLGSKRPLPS
jgi:hypothetical protein